MNEPAEDRVRELERTLAQPETQARLARALAGDGPATPVRRWRPFLAGAVSGAVAVFAFVLPTLQEQWNVYRTSQAVERYADIGRHLMEQEQFHAAEEAFARALELAGGQRIDLLQEQLRAHVQMMNDDARWPGKVPEDLRESDFVYLLELQVEPEQQLDRAATLTVYGAYLASEGRAQEAETRLREALRLDPQNVATHLNLGNLLADLGRPQEAEREYRRALLISPDEPGAHYDLALLLEGEGRLAEAQVEYQAYLKLEPGDVEAAKALTDLAARSRTTPKPK